MNITEFLEARISEDEAAARAAADSTRGAGWSAQQLDHEGLSVYGDDPAGQIDFDSDDALPTLEYLVRFDPARVLAECAAKRAILEIAVDQIRLGQEAAGWQNWEDMASQTLRALAAVYKDHQDYQEEWAA